MTSFALTIAGAIADETGPLWWPVLTGPLAAFYLPAITDYSTSRQLGLQEYASTFVEVIGSQHICARVELLRSPAISQFSARGLDLCSAEELADGKSFKVISSALDMINKVQSLGDCIHSLVRSLHVLRPQDPSVDVSFSEPALPFSIFVSVPNIHSDQIAMRVAESIVHEAMHLLLSLVERSIPLVTTHEKKHYSPWRNQLREAGGLLHGMYVFRVIFDWLGFFRETPVAAYAHHRRAQIREQLLGSNLPLLEASLNSNGAALARRIVANI